MIPRPPRSTSFPSRLFPILLFQVQRDADDTDPDDTNDDSFARAAVSAIPDPPVAAFTYSPGSPIAGEAVQFNPNSFGIASPNTVMGAAYGTKQVSEEAVESIPDCPGCELLQLLI